jgi:hypothetical protein
MKLLRQAIELDADYAVVYAHLGIAHFVQPYFSPVSAASIEASAGDAIDRAFELDDSLPEAYVARAYWRRFPVGLGRCGTRLHTGARDQPELFRRVSVAGPHAAHLPTTGGVDR